MASLFLRLANRANSLGFQLAYFLTLSLLGFLALKFSNPRANSTTTELKDVDVFFTSVSAATVSSMSTIEMEVFSNFQLIVMTVLMLVGGEVFTSMLELQFMRAKFKFPKSTPKIITLTKTPDLIQTSSKPEKSVDLENPHPHGPLQDLKYESIKCLGYVVLCYLMVLHILGSTLVSTYLTVVSSARELLKSRGISIQTFSVFTVVSTFANCGFVPTNENMMAFKHNPGLLLLIFPHILFGNTLYPTCLRIVIVALKKVTGRAEFGYMLEGSQEIGYSHLMPGLDAWLLGLTVLGFIAVQFMMFCSMEWNSGVLEGMSPYEKFVGALFQTVNTRHAGESIVDISIISPAILALFVVMMYLPPYTSVMVRKDIGQEEGRKQGRERESSRKSRALLECLRFSQLSYLIIFIILVCITEREKLRRDPLNFNVLNITIEVISAYGNVGYSTGYSCKRQLNPESSCKDAFSGFTGRWSGSGKFILIIVMFFGRLKKFNMTGGQAWKLS